jgi:hypothetical protein
MRTIYERLKAALLLKKMIFDQFCTPYPLTLMGGSGSSPLQIILKTLEKSRVFAFSKEVYSWIIDAIWCRDTNLIRIRV